MRYRSCSWFEHLSPIGLPDCHFFCFPFAAGNVNAFRAWQKRLPPEIDLCLVHLPGHAYRSQETPFTRLDHLVRTLADQILHELQAPFAFYGHSMGALISFELGRELVRRRSAPPLHLFLSGRNAPQLLKPDPVQVNGTDHELIEYLEQLEGTPRAVLENAELLEIVLPIVRADVELVNSYQYYDDMPPLPCSLTIYGGHEDTHVPVEDLGMWRVHTSAECTVRTLRGNHFFIHDPNVNFCDVLLQDIARVLAELRLA
jgi:medium-chain acyl-[acyl-carrier-protein] hydrolase